VPPKRLVQMTVSRPYIAHASMGPSCALAEFRDGHLTVRSHGQGMHPLRKNLAAALGLPIEAITARHLHGAGCYGHNGADDAALDASLIALRLPGRCIRLQWRREEEFGFEPAGPAAVTLHVDLDERGVADWTTEAPPMSSGRARRLPARHRGAGEPAARGRRPIRRRRAAAAARAIRCRSTTCSAHPAPPGAAPAIRTSALRGLGAPNVYAIRSLMDELAARAGGDPSPTVCRSCPSRGPARDRTVAGDTD
jgi:CO/xanthine dehydrogenase Mo-binding subunit